MSRPIIAYRIERDGVGPYRQSWPWREELHMAHHAGCPTRPNQRQDLDNLEFGAEYIARDTAGKCAFSSSTEMRRWFKGWMRRLRRSEFKVYRLELEPSAYLGVSGRQYIYLDKEIISKTELPWRGKLK